LLLVDPAYVDDAGFRLSVLATAGLMAWGTGLTNRLAGTAPGRIRAWLAESLGVSLAAQAATLPVILLEFGRLSLVSPSVNLAGRRAAAPAMLARAASHGGTGRPGPTRDASAARDQAGASSSREQARAWHATRGGGPRRHLTGARDRRRGAAARRHDSDRPRC